MAEDMRARLDLLETIIERVQRPVEDGGAGLVVQADIRQDGKSGPALSLFYVFSVFD